VLYILVLVGFLLDNLPKQKHDIKKVLKGNFKGLKYNKKGKIW
jgi:hypothetical protein